MTYNVYEIYKKDDAGEWLRVDTGGVQDAEMGRAIARENDSQKATTPVAAKVRGKRATASATANDGKRNQHLPSKGFPGTAKPKRSQSALSPFQRRLNEAIELAKQTAAERKARKEN